MISVLLAGLLLFVGGMALGVHLMDIAAHVRARRRVGVVRRKRTLFGKKRALQDSRVFDQQIAFKQQRRIEERQAWRNEYERLDPLSHSEKQAIEFASRGWSSPEAQRNVRERHRNAAIDKKLERQLAWAQERHIIPREPSPRPPAGGAGVSRPAKAEVVDDRVAELMRMNATLQATLDEYRRISKEARAPMKIMDADGTVITEG